MATTIAEIALLEQVSDIPRNGSNTNRHHLIPAFLLWINRHPDVIFGYNQTVKTCLIGGHNGLGFNARVGFTYWYWYFSCFTWFNDLPVSKSRRDQQTNKGIYKGKGDRQEKRFARERWLISKMKFSSFLRNRKTVLNTCTHDRTNIGMFVRW